MVVVLIFAVVVIEICNAHVVKEKGHVKEKIDSADVDYGFNVKIEISITVSVSIGAIH